MNGDRWQVLKSRQAGRLVLFCLGWLCVPGLCLAQGQAGSPDPYIEAMKYYREGQYEEALPLLRQSAAGGYVEAEYQLCMMYKRGQGLKAPEAGEAYAWCKKAADKGHGPAEFELANSLQTGWGVAANPAAALDYYLKASKQGVPEAQYALGLFYEFGEMGVKQSYYQARTLFMWASGKGYSPATYRVGVFYEEGKGVRPNMAAAMRWYTKAASMGNADAIARLDALRQEEQAMEAAADAAERAEDERIRAARAAAADAAADD